MKNPERMATTVADAIEMCTEPLRARIAVLERDTKSLSRELAELRSELAIEKAKTRLTFRGIFQAGRYEAGDAVTRAGALWIAVRATTSTPGDEPPASPRDWQLAVKKGAAT